MKLNKKAIQLQLEELRTDFLLDRKQYEDIHRKSEESFDKVVITLSCAAIGWFITFHKYIDFGCGYWGSVLKWTVLGGFGLSLVSNLISYWTARWNASKKIEEADNNYEQRKADILARKEPSPVEDKVFFAQKLTVFFNQMALYCVIIGVIGILLSVGMADSGEKRTCSNNSVKKEFHMAESINDGAVKRFAQDGATAIKKAPEARVFHDGLTPVAKQPPKKEK